MTAATNTITIHPKAKDLEYFADWDELLDAGELLDATPAPTITVEEGDVTIGTAEVIDTDTVVFGHTLKAFRAIRYVVNSVSSPADGRLHIVGNIGQKQPAGTQAYTVEV